MERQRFSCKTKKELAFALDVSPRTLGRWLNDRYIDELEPLGYRKKDRLLNPKIVSYLSDKLGIVFQEISN